MLSKSKAAPSSAEVAGDACDAALPIDGSALNQSGVVCGASVDSGCRSALAPALTVLSSCVCESSLALVVCMQVVWVPKPSGCGPESKLAETSAAGRRDLICASPMLPIVAALIGAPPRRLPSIAALRGGLPPLTAELPAPELHALSEAGSSSALASWWGENRMLLLSIVGSLALLAPALRSLPRAAALTGTVLIVTLVQMAFDLPPDLVLLEAVVALVGLGVISMKDALDGFRSEGVVAVGVMCAVAKAVQTTGGLTLITKYLLGSPVGYEMALLRMIIAVMCISAFMNNTPVCAMMIPILAQWGAGLGIPQSSLLMPLSFATMLGGTLTMIGSSTNLVAANAGATHDPSFSMKVFDITAIGAINAAAGTAYMVLAGRHLLPKASAPPPVAQKPGGAVTAAPPRGTVRLWVTLALITTTMTVASQQPKALLPMALGCLCVLVRLGCLTLKEAWSAVNGPVLLSIALSFALGAAIKKSDLASIVATQVRGARAPTLGGRVGAGRCALGWGAGRGGRLGHRRGEEGRKAAA